MPQNLEPVPASFSKVTLARIMDITDSNLHGNVHGGVIMKFVDDAAGACVHRHLRGGRAVTAAVDEMVLRVPVHVGDILTAHASINGTWTTSIEVGVRVTAQAIDGAVGEPHHVASAYLVMVGIDADEQPTPVAPVVAESADDRRRGAEADIRRASRLSRREAIARSRADG